MSEFTHFDEQGNAYMVDVSDKEITKRTAVAQGTIKLSEEAVDPDDIETLQDLIMAAANEALRQVDEESSQTMGKLAGGLGGGYPF